VVDARPYNHNQDSFAIECIVRWFDYWRERPGTGKLVSSGGVNIIFSDTNTHYRGAENYRRSGVVDALRIPKDGYFTHQVMWDGWLETQNHTNYIIGHWNYEKDVVKDVYVVSTSDKTELFVNDKSLGFGEQSYKFLHTFKDVNWEAGTIKAVSYDKAGNVLYESEKSTAGKPDRIELNVITDPNGFKADGADLALIEVEVVDADGNRCPTSNAMINFDLEGPAEWRGGIAQGPDNYILSKSIPVECGVNRVIVRSGLKAGEIKITATATNLKSGSVTFNSHSVKVVDGLSMDIPGEKLQSFVGMGPTPEDVPLKITRESVEIVNAIAGSNQQDAYKSFDGNQETRWTNEGDLQSAWIKYEFKRETEINQIALKMSGWRTRGYPIVVKAGDKQVYSGLSERNLGYFYITFDPVKAKDISVRLFGETEYKDTFNIVEITGKLDKETQADKQVKNVESLNIVDVEVFFKPTD